MVGGVVWWVVQLITLSTPTRVEVELGWGCGWAVTTSLLQTVLSRSPNLIKQLKLPWHLKDSYLKPTLICQILLLYAPTQNSAIWENLFHLLPLPSPTLWTKTQCTMTSSQSRVAWSRVWDDPWWLYGRRVQDICFFITKKNAKKNEEKKCFSLKSKQNRLLICYWKLKRKEKQFSFWW